MAFEENLHQMRLTGRGQDAIRYPSRLAEQIAYLSGGVSSSDFVPTAQQREVHGEIRQELRVLQGRFDALMSRDLAEFNAMLAERGLGGIVDGR